MLQENRIQTSSENPGNGVSIYFICQDAQTIYHQLTEKEIYASEPFVGNNMWVTGLKDPDGYSLYFESPTNVTEGTILSDWLKMKG